MEILGIGPLELLFILLIALIAVGPKDLGKAARSMGRLLNQLYKSEAWQNLGEASRNIRTLPNRLAREAALEELAQVKREMEEGVTSGIDKIKTFDFESDQPDGEEQEGARFSPDQPDADAQVDTEHDLDEPGADQPKDAEPTSDQPIESPSPEQK